MSDDPSEKTRFQPGRSGNPRGRPKGSRNKFGEDFLEDFLADWEEGGRAAIRKVREEKPDAYLKVAASILPRELHVKTDAIEEMTDEELEQNIRRLMVDVAESYGYVPGPNVHLPEGAGEKPTPAHPGKETTPPTKH